MKPSIYHDQWGEPVCCDCGRPFGEGERAMVSDDEVMCWECAQKWAEDDLAGMIDQITSGDARMIYSCELDRLVSEEREDEEEAAREEYERIMRNND